MKTRSPLPIRLIPTCVCLAAGVACVALADPPLDPLSLLNQPRTPLEHLSASTMPGRSDMDHAIDRGMRYLEFWQHQNGSWDRLENANGMQMDDPDQAWRYFDFHEYRDFVIKDNAEKANEEIADTCLAARTMLLAVVSGRNAELAPKCRKAILYLCGQIEKHDDGTILVQTRLFDPLHDPTPALGEARYYDPTIDTFFALNFLSEARDKLADDDVRQQVDRALVVLRDKIVRNQNVDGTWTEDAVNPISMLSNDPFKTPILPQVAAMNGRFPPQWPRVGPENGKLPKDTQHMAEQYESAHRNIIVHCEALRAISIACRHGMKFSTETRFAAENYLRHGFNGKLWDKRSDGYYEADTSPKAILLTAVIAAWYQADLTSHYLADAADKKAKAHVYISTDELNALHAHAQSTRAELLRQVRRFQSYNVIPICGPALEDLPDLLAALKLAPADDSTDTAYLTQRLIRTMLARQRASGEFIAGTNDKASQYERLGTDRGDNTFGTADTVRLLMQLASTPAPP